MAAETDRTWLYALGAVGVVWLLMSRRAQAATSSTSSTTSAADPIVTFPPNDPNVDLKPLFCAPWDQYGGWGDDRKIAEGTRLYVERWGFSPTPEFVDAVAKRDPCERRHFDALVNAFPPFPGQSFTSSQLAAKRGRQAEARKADEALKAQAKKDCEATVVGGATVVGSVAGGIVGGVVGIGTLGAGSAAVVPGVTAGGSAGGALGKFISGVWC